MNNQNSGKYGEDLATELLQKNGYKIIERNFKIRGGEVDIIAIDNNALVYVEVKTRSSAKYGLPEEAVTSRKLNYIKHAAKFYKSKNKNLPKLERIDVVAVDISKPQSPKLRLIKNATF